MVAKKTSLRLAQRTSFDATKKRRSLCLSKGHGCKKNIASTGSADMLWCSKKTPLTVPAEGAWLQKKHRFDWLSERVLTQKKKRRSLSLSKGRVGKETSLRLAQRTSFDATKNVAPCACRRGVRMLHSSWAWRCFSHHFLANQYKGMGGFFQNKPTPPCSPFSWRASDNERERRAKGR